MRRSRTLLVTLVLLLLAPSLLMASAGTWGWLMSSPSSAASEEPAVTSAEEPAKSTEDSASSKTTSKAAKASQQYVVIPADVYSAAVADIREGNETNKKGGATVTAAADSLEGAASFGNAAPKMKYFGSLDAAYDFGKVELGVGLGFIFKDCLIGKVGVVKKDVSDFSNWLDWKTAYRATASLGIIF